MMVGWEASEVENEGSHSGLSQEASHRDGEETEEQLTGLSLPRYTLVPGCNIRKDWLVVIWKAWAPSMWSLKKNHHAQA